LEMWIMFKFRNNQHLRLHMFFLLWIFVHSLYHLDFMLVCFEINTKIIQYSHFLDLLFITIFKKISRFIMFERFFKNLLLGQIVYFWLS
jgi:hypothetical protein